MENTQKSQAIPGAVDLAPDSPGYQMRMLERTIEPGKSLAMHSHEKRPGLSYVLEGTLTETMADGAVRQYGPGEVITESRATIHAVENRGPKKVVLLGAHVIKKRLDQS